jgi:hypothetical protein
MADQVHCISASLHDSATVYFEAGAVAPRFEDLVVALSAPRVKAFMFTISTYSPEDRRRLMIESRRRAVSFTSASLAGPRGAAYYDWVDDVATYLLAKSAVEHKPLALRTSTPRRGSVRTE